MNRCPPVNALSDTSSLTLYACPVCQLPLVNRQLSLVCENNHHFDRHKKGYVNLLLSQYKQSKAPGDNPDMVDGRRAFLEGGHYQPFADAIVQLIRHAFTSPPPLHNHTNPLIVDAGCGEGFYTRQIQQAMPSPYRVYGFDISKPAIHAAANNKAVEWSVASSNRPPFTENSADMIVSIFSRIEIAAFSRVLKAEGYVLYAASGDNHLHQLRTIIYDTVTPYSTSKHHDYFDDSFQLIEEQSLAVPIKLNTHKEIMNLVSMTPHAHRMPKSGYERLINTETLVDTADFKLYLYQKK